MVLSENGLWPVPGSIGHMYSACFLLTWQLWGRLHHSRWPQNDGWLNTVSKTNSKQPLQQIKLHLTKPLSIHYLSSFPVQSDLFDKPKYQIVHVGRFPRISMSMSLLPRHHFQRVQHRQPSLADGLQIFSPTLLVFTSKIVRQSCEYFSWTRLMVKSVIIHA